jgi:hypothetical protein
MDRLGRTLDLALAAFGLAGLAALSLLWMAPPLRIGTGQFDAWVQAVETRDFKSWLVGAVLVMWLVPVALGLLWRHTRHLARESLRVRSILDSLARPSIPVKVDVDTRVPVHILEPLLVPVELHTRVGVDHELEVEAEIPVKAEIPVDAEVEATVLRFGTIRVPVKAVIPVDVVLPVKGRIRVRASDIPVDVRDIARVQLPPFEVPFVSRLETRIDLLANLRGDREPAPAPAPAPVPAGS